MSVTRRQVVQRGAVALAATTVPQHRMAAVLSKHLGHPGGSAHRATGVGAGWADPQQVKALALRAVDAARAAGASYADVRLTRTIAQMISNRHGGYVHGMADDEERAVGVRALVNGYWGFAASPAWTPDEMTLLAKRATELAAANAKGAPRVVEWTPVPAVTGEWTMPAELDPLTIPLEERSDYIGAMHDRLGGTGVTIGVDRQEQALATSEGTYCTTTRWQLGAPNGLLYTPGGTNGDMMVYHAFPGRQTSGWGWEHYGDPQKLFDMARVVEAEVRCFYDLPRRGAELGRYDLVLDGEVTASLVGATLAKATELDRALGYEANATGTSYLGPDVLSLLGQRQVGSPLLTLTANRSLPHAPATVPWDAEGVVPEDATLIKDGILVDYQTNREQAGWLRPYYERAGKPVRSHGYAGAQSGLYITQQQTPNLRLEPGTPGTPVAEMIKGIKKGIYCFWGGNGGFNMDFQLKTGLMSWITQREITNGKLGAIISGRPLFNSVELWKSLVAIGPAAELGVGEFGHRKGQPGQTASYAIEAVPTHFKNVTVIH